MRRTLFTAVALMIPAVARAQAPLPKPEWTGITAKARSQIEEVTEKSKKFDAQSEARQSGFIPVLGWIPTMGTHWVNNPRMFREGKAVDLDAPVQLMYSPVNGKETLVGAAYSYLTVTSDTTRPSSFDGNPMWHEHPDLAPPGMRLVMLHVWFVPSPDGPFAGNNPNLPFWATGVTPPAPELLKDHEGDIRVRKTALALALVADSSGLFPLLHRKADVHAAEVARTDSVRAVMPELDAAAKAKDWPRWNRAADKAVVQWDALRETWLAATTRPENKVKITRFLDDMTTGMHDMSSMHH